MRIRQATAADAPMVADLIAHAFTPLQASEWLIPPPRDRRRILAAYFRIFIDHAVEYGHIDMTEDALAVAVWFPRTAELPEPPGYDRRLAEASHPWTDRFRMVDALIEGRHPTHPHHHLAFLAVHPDHQRAGRGTALLRRYHTHLDATGTPAYLEASSPGARELYLRHGYEQSPPYTLPNGAPFWPMHRAPARS